MRVDEIEIPHPCPIDLREQIARASEQFHCEHCDRSVHVLSHMSEEQAARVLARRERDNLCVAALCTPDGEVHFRRSEPALVPVARLSHPRRILRASALVLSVAACSADDGSPFARLARDKSERNVGLAVHGGPPPGRFERFERVEPKPCPLPDEPEPDEAVERWVNFAELEARHTPDPPNARLLEFMGSSYRPVHRLTVEYCVDLRGRVVDAKLLDGDEELGAILLETMTTAWEFEPHMIDGCAARVCTEQVVTVNLGRLEGRTR